jgi:CRISPR-associated endonuclease/helicase Cas3
VKGFRHELASALAWLQAGPKDQPDRDLVAYLIAAHHGKVRLSIRSLPDEKPTPNDVGRLFARGVWDGDKIPAVQLDKSASTLPVTLDLSPMKMGDTLSGQPSWLSRMINLRDRIGLFRIAYYETLLRAADWQASAKNETH